MKSLIATDLSAAGLLSLDSICSAAGLFESVVLLHVVDLDLYTAGGSVPQILEFASGEARRSSAVRLAGCGLAPPCASNRALRRDRGARSRRRGCRPRGHDESRNGAPTGRRLRQHRGEDRLPRRRAGARRADTTEQRGHGAA